MKYILLLHVNEAGWPKLTKTQQEAGLAAYVAYTEALKAAGAFIVTHRLGSSSRKQREYLQPSRQSTRPA